jgi:hypothetical protein
MIDCPKREGRVVTQLVLRTKYNDVPVYVAFLPALLILVGLGVTATIAWHNQALWNATTLSATRGDADDYVQGLAKRGIAKLPGYEPSPGFNFTTQAIAAE